MSTRPARRGSLTPLDEPTTALGYGRVSSKEQRQEGVSIPNQSATVRAYIDSRASLGWLFGDEYFDVESGTRVNRANYQRLLTEIRRLTLEGERVVLVVARLDRLGRNLKERVRVWEEMKALGVPIYSIAEGGIQQEVVYNVLASLAQEEVRLLGERVHDAIVYFEAALWRPVGRPAWGYTWREATDAERADKSPNRVLIPAEAEARFVREAWAMRARGSLMREVARWIAALPADARGGRVFSFGTARRMFEAPVYVGRPGVYDADPEAVLARPVAKWEPLIDDATYRAAQETAERGRRLAPQASGQYALTGLLWCPSGARMYGRRKTHGVKKRPEYACGCLHRGAVQGACERQYVVPADRVEPLVVGIVREMLAACDRPKMHAEMERDYAQRQRRADTAGGLDARKSLEMRRAEAQKELAANARARVAGIIDDADFKAAKAAIVTELDAIAAEEERLAEQPKPLVLPSLRATLASVKGLRTAVERVGAENPSGVRAALAALVEKIEPERVGRGEYVVHLQWTPAGLTLLQAAQAMGALEMVSVDAFGQTKASTLTISGTAAGPGLRAP